jgi:hypothetical protein
MATSKQSIIYLGKYLCNNQIASFVNDLFCLVFFGLNLSLVEPLAWKPLTLIVQLIKYVKSLNT